MNNQSFTHKGFIVFPDLAEIQELTEDIIGSYTLQPIEVRLVRNPNGSNEIFLCDLPNTDEAWGGNFRCFFYPEDNKVLGTFKYLKEANQPDEKIDGRYEVADNVIKVKGIAIRDSKPVFGLYAELHKIF